VILSQAGRFGGWSLYVTDGKPMYTYNYAGLSASKVASPMALARRQGDDPLRVQLRRPVAWVRAGMGTLFVDGETVAEGRIDRTQPKYSRLMKVPMSASMARHRLTSDYKERENKFTGKIGRSQSS